MSARLIALTLLCLALTGAERDSAIPWCERQGGTSEVVLADNSRCDCLTREYAVEVERASKWKESIGQALHYGRMTKRKPGIALILEKNSDARHVEALRKTLKHYKLEVRVWEVR